LTTSKDAFDESQYLEANPDVADAVARGDIASGWAHYESHGRDEGRDLRIDPQRVLHLPPGARHYRAYIGSPRAYDTLAAYQFNLLTSLGLREDHRLLDIGCGSLRAGKLFIPYLLPGNYAGVEPERWLIDAGIEHELGASILDVKHPQFCTDRQCSYDHFGLRFDFAIAQSVYTHSPLTWLRHSIKSVARVLAPGGLLAANFDPGESDYDGDVWAYPEICRYQPATVRGLVEQAGLVYRELAPHLDRIWFVAQAPD
jgi:SAM-dependent methyltransferase